MKTAEARTLGTWRTKYHSAREFMEPRYICTW